MGRKRGFLLFLPTHIHQPAQPTPTTYLLIALAALISVCRCMRAGAGWSMLSKVSVQGVWKVVLMLWVGKEGTDSFLP